ncbi:general secretion pathway protein K [cyanobacterium TDX16]|nr:general secretion pathway protein K [cyanobacterium TDX16]
MNVSSTTNNAITVSFEALNETSNRLRQAGAIFLVKKVGKDQYQIILKKPLVTYVSELLKRA